MTSWRWEVVDGEGVRVYRVEHYHDRKGPFTGFSRLKMYSHIFWMEGIPDAENDFSTGCPTTHLYAFPLLALLKKWVPIEDRRFLHQHGFVLGVWLTDVAFGSKSGQQVAFNRERAQRHREHSLYPLRLRL